MQRVSSGIQDQILFLFDIFLSLDNCETSEIVATASFRSFRDSENIFSELYFFGQRIEQPTMNSPPFFGTESFLKGLPLTSKAARGYFGQIVWYWIKGNIVRLDKIPPDTNNKGFT